MDNIQDVCAQLMKPPRELARWNFPLSQVIERYFDLLEDPSQIHYSDAALVIQNAVNAYVRRVEELYDETRCFSQKLITATKEPTEQQHVHKERKGSKKSLIDFTHFQPLDFEKEVGKNINLKSQEGKPLKFLHRCFSQLENSRTNIQLNVLDVNGEIIGKKYDFRCCQQMTRNGMLVDEFVPNDFINHPREKINIQTSSSLPSKENTETDKTSGYSSNASSHDSNEKVESASESVQERIESGRKETCESSEGPEPETEPELNHESTRSLNKNSTFSNESSSYNDALQADHHNDDDSDDAVELELFLEDASEPIEIDPSPQETPTETPHAEVCENASPEEVSLNNETEPLSEVCKNVNSREQLSLSNGIERLKENVDSSSAPGKENSELTVINCKRTQSTEEQCKENENVNMSDVNDNQILNITEKSENSIRRSKRLKSAAKELEPIPFNNGIPEKLVKSRSEFRLPCHISLLKSSPKKRKITHKTPRKGRKTFHQEPTKSPTQTSSLIQTEKMTMYSPTRPIFTALKDEDQKGFRRSLDEKFKRQGFNVNYESVSTLTMDLLGFHPCYTKSDPHVDSLGYSTPARSSGTESRFSLQRSSTPMPSSNPSSSSLHPEHLTPPLSPCASDIFETNADDDGMGNDQGGEMRTPSKPNRSDFENLVKHKIKEIYDELDLHNDDDQKIARWHEEIKPRLMEAERKPPFHIHQYGGVIIERLSANRRKIPFDDMVREQPREEVARYFSAALQLASTHNVDINPSEDLNSSIELILLD